MSSPKTIDKRPAERQLISSGEPHCGSVGRHDRNVAISRLAPQVEFIKKGRKLRASATTEVGYASVDMTVRLSQRDTETAWQWPPSRVADSNSDTRMPSLCEGDGCPNPGRTPANDGYVRQDPSLPDGFRLKPGKRRLKQVKALKA
jgi:hypothetical protein